MQKKGKNRPLVGLIFRMVIRCFSCLSLKWAHRFGVIIGWCLWLLPNSLKKISTDNISNAYPDYPVSKRQLLVRSSLIELGKGFCELGQLWCWSREKLLPLVDDNGWQHAIGTALKQGRGVIILSPHLGAWELMGWYGSIFYPLTSLYRPPRVSSISDFMRNVRQRDGARLVPTDVSGIKALLKALKSNETIGILPDQDPGKNGGVLAPFFNHPANTITLLAKLMQKTGAPVIFSFAERLPKGEGYKIHLIEAGKGLDATNDSEAAASLNRQIEECVQLLPAQYLWSYGRYRKVKKYQRRQQQQ